MFVVLVTSVGLLQQGSPLLFPIHNRHLVHYYMLTLLFFMLTSVYGNYYLVMGRVCITVNLLIDQNNIFVYIRDFADDDLCSGLKGRRPLWLLNPPPPPPVKGGGVS